MLYDDELIYLVTVVTCTSAEWTAAATNHQLAISFERLALAIFPQLKDEWSGSTKERLSSIVKKFNGFREIVRPRDFRKITFPE